jgi:hypothetical protein
MQPEWLHHRNHHEPHEMSTDDIVACYELAARLRKYEHGPSLDMTLRLYLFSARQELATRGREHLERIRDYLPVYYDPTRKRTLHGPGAELYQPAERGERDDLPGHPPILRRLGSGVVGADNHAVGADQVASRYGE